MPAHSGPSGDLPQAFDEIKLAFIYVPDGLPPPWEWMALYPDHIKMPATYVPRASGVGASNRSFGAPPPGQHGPADGRVAPSGPRAPSVPAGNAASDAMSAPTHAIDDRTLNPNGPINAFRLADAGLRTAASDYSFANSGVSEIHANVASNQFGFVDPSGPSINLSDPIRETNWHQDYPEFRDLVLRLQLQDRWVARMDRRQHLRQQPARRACQKPLRGQTRRLAPSRRLRSDLPFRVVLLPRLKMG